MYRADATIAWVDSSGIAQAQDYYLSGYVQVCVQNENHDDLLVPKILRSVLEINLKFRILHSI